MQGIMLFLAIAGIIVGIVIFWIVASYFRLWIRSYTCEAGIGFFNLIGMTLRRVDAGTIVDARVMAVQAGIADEFSIKDMEAHYLAGGRVRNVVAALIAADRADIPLKWKRATAIDLAGRDIVDAVKTSVNPRVIDCPDPAKGKQTIEAVAMDGIQLKAKVRVTVRTNIERLVGGATEETIIARGGEGIVATIGSAASYKRVLESPDMITRTLLAKGLDAGSAFEILSIDISSVDVGDNVGAKLQADQAEADMRVARATAEGRRAMAAAREQEMRAQTQENRAKVVLAEAEIPKAIAQAFREGNLGIMDYYRLKNIQSDTDMRSSIAGGEEQQQK